MEINKVIIILLIAFFSLPFIMLAENYKGYNLPYYDNGIGGPPSGLGGAFFCVDDVGNHP